MVIADEVDLTRRLVSIPSTRGAEHEAEAFVFRELGARGDERDRPAMDPAALARHSGDAPVPLTADHSRAPIVVGLHRPRREAGAA